MGPNGDNMTPEQRKAFEVIKDYLGPGVHVLNIASPGETIQNPQETLERLKDEGVVPPGSHGYMVAMNNVEDEFEKSSPEELVNLVDRKVTKASFQHGVDLVLISDFRKHPPSIENFEALRETKIRVGQYSRINWRLASGPHAIRVGDKVTVAICHEEGVTLLGYYATGGEFVDPLNPSIEGFKLHVKLAGAVSLLPPSFSVKNPVKIPHAAVLFQEPFDAQMPNSALIDSMLTSLYEDEEYLRWHDVFQGE